jgi:hypothetical protein
LWLLRLLATVQSVILNGTLPDELGDPPAMLSVTCRDNRPFISIIADLNPVDASCDANLDVNLEAITVVFDAVSCAFNLLDKPARIKKLNSFCRHLGYFCMLI